MRNGGIWAEQQKLLPADVAADDHFGESVSVSGDSLVAGSPDDDTGFGINAGSAYVFVRSGAVWAEESKLIAPSGKGADRFGSAVSTHLDTAAVGAPQRAGGPQGYVDVFRRVAGVWSVEQSLQPTVYSEGFGAAVALETDTIVVGAPKEGASETWAGAAYVFVRSGGVWTEEQRLTASVPGSFAEFGHSVAVSGSAALTGAPGSGSAYVFRRTGAAWTEETRLDAPGTTSFEGFGTTVALEGDVLAVGAPNDAMPGAPGAGSVYIFVRTGLSWTLQQKVIANDASAYDHFGAAVALSADTLVVGAPAAAGGAYVFVRAAGIWQLQEKLVTPRPFEGFGCSVSLDGDSLIVGAPGENEGGAFEAGAAYVFVRFGALWGLVQRLVSASPANNDQAGFAVALEGDTAIVGLPEIDGGNGKAVAFRRVAAGWVEEGTLSASDGAPFDGFGGALALSGDSLIIGSPYAEVQGVFSAGAAYAFVRSGSLWTQQQKLVAADPHLLDRLGTAIANSGDTALAGAPQG